MRLTSLTRSAAVLGVVAATALVASPASAETEVPRPSSFTSAYTVNATPDNIIDPNGAPVAGQAGASGTFTFQINSDQEIICYDITLSGVTPPFQSMAKTATHVHQAAAGTNGPPRIAFPNPVDTGNGQLKSSGCLQGPFTTGLTGTDGADTGTGFTLASIEANPAGFSADTHTAANVPGAVRGQLTQIPVGGVDTGFGGTADEGGTVAPAAAALLAGLGLAAAAGVAANRRRVRA